MDTESNEIDSGIGGVEVETPQSQNAEIMADMQEVLAGLGGEEAPAEQTLAPEEDDAPAIEAEADDDAEHDDESSADDEQAAQPSALDETVNNWQSVLDQLGQTPDQAFNNYMQAVVSLTQSPVQAITQLASQYVHPQQAQQLIAALASQHNIDPFDVDVDDYKSQAPIIQRDQQLAQLQSQIQAMQVAQMKASGQFPMLSDNAVQTGMSQLMNSMPGLSFEDAYNLHISRNPDLSAKHRKAVDGKAESKSAADKDADRKTRLRRAKASDLPKGAAGSRSGPSTSANSVLDDVREAAIEIGFGSG